MSPTNNTIDIEQIKSAWSHLWQLYRKSDGNQVKYILVKRSRINSVKSCENYHITKSQAVKLIQDLELVPPPQQLLKRSTVYRQQKHHEILSNYQQKRVFQKVLFGLTSAKGSYKGLDIDIYKQDNLFCCKIEKKQEVLLNKSIYATDIKDAINRALVAVGY